VKPERISGSTEHPFSERECLLSAGELPAAGTHIVTNRRGYSHHGIYIGNGKVIHYAGLSRDWFPGPIEEVAFDRFAGRRAVFMRPHTMPRFDRIEVVRRARSRVGETSYRLLTNNCEHFCEWCIRGEPRSRQVDALRHKPRQFIRTLRRAIACGLDLLGSREPPRGGWAV
jgi:hypothetical protein